jgi:hypothetical protein
MDRAKPLRLRRSVCIDDTLSFRGGGNHLATVDRRSGRQQTTFEKLKSDWSKLRRVVAAVATSTVRLPLGHKKVHSYFL